METRRGKEEATWSMLNSPSHPNQESLKEVVPGFSQHLGQMGRPLWMHRERLQTQMERVQRLGVFRNETWRVWARLRVFLETT